MHAPQCEKNTVCSFQAFKKRVWLAVAAAVCAGAIPHGLLADEKEAVKDVSQEAQAQAAQQPPAAEQAPKSLWKYSGFLDFGYLLDFNHPANHLFRDRATTFHVDELDLNIAAAGIKKE